MSDLAGDRSEQKTGETPVSPGSHDEQVRILGGVHQRGGGGIPNKKAPDVHTLSVDGLQRLSQDTFSGMKGVVSAAVFHR